MTTDDVRKVLEVARPGDGSNPAPVSPRGHLASIPAGSSPDFSACPTIPSSEDYLGSTSLLARPAGKSTLAVVMLVRHGLVSGFEVSGHARFGAPGQDIVCAGVSAVAQATQRALEHIVPGLESKQGSGSLRVSVPETFPDRLTQAVMGILLTAEFGFKGIAESYPGCLTVRSKEVT